METISPIRPTPSLESARLRQPQPVQPNAEPEAAPLERRRFEAPSPQPLSAPESLEGRDLADPFEARRSQERFEGTAETPLAQNLGADASMLTQRAVNDAANELTETERGQDPSQAAATPRAVARYQNVPRARADRLTATGTTEAEPEPLAEAASEGRLEEAESIQSTRSTLERTNEERVRRGSADIAGTALSAAGEQLATVVDDRALESQPPEVTPIFSETPEDGVDSPETTGFDATLPGVGDMKPSRLEPREDELRAP